MVALSLADLRRELNGLARAGAVFAPDWLKPSYQPTA